MSGFMRVFSVAMVLIAASLLSSAATARERMALLIGNQSYAERVGRLSNPLNDVDVVGAALKKVGFKVTIIKDADYSTMHKATKNFSMEVGAASPGAVSFFYYSGHGAAQARTQTNYLIPVDVITAEDDTLWQNSIELKDIIDKLSSNAPTATHYVVFDACRNELQLASAAKKSLGRLEKGFVPVAQTAGLLIAYATAPTKSASDVGEKVGPYARILAEEIERPAVEAVTMFRNVQVRVKEEVGQDPWVTFPTLPVIYFGGEPERGPQKVAIPSINLAESQSATELETFLGQMPDGPYARKLRERLKEVKRNSAISCAGGRAWPPSSVVVGATNIPASRAPWSALLRTRTKTMSEHLGSKQGELLYFCGAVAVGSEWVMTAAHCLEEAEHIKRFGLEVVIGVEDLASVNPSQVYEVSAIVRHEQFASSDSLGVPKGPDIALIKLARPWNGSVARLSKDVEADPPALSATKPTGRMLGAIAGFGTTPSNRTDFPLRRFGSDDGGYFLSTSQRLREVVVPIVNQEKCLASYQEALTGSNICTGFEFGGADMCQGASGSPVTAYDANGCPYVIGTQSWARGCGQPQGYGVLTRVASYIDWIRTHVPDVRLAPVVATADGDQPLSDEWRAILGLPLSEVDQSQPLGANSPNGTK